MTWKLYERFGSIEVRPYKLGEDLEHVSLSEVDDPGFDRGYIARNPDNHADQWYVAKAYFEKHYRPVSREQPAPLGDNGRGSSGDGSA